MDLKQGSRQGSFENYEGEGVERRDSRGVIYELPHINVSRRGGVQSQWRVRTLKG